MSRENVETVRRAFDAVNRRNLDGLLATTDEEVEATSYLTAVEGDYHGHAGIDTLLWIAVQVRRERCVWWQAFPDRDEALEAVRLSE